MDISSHIFLKNLFFEAELQFNLMGVSKTTTFNFDVNFSKIYAHIQEPSSKRTIGKAKLRGKLYFS